MKLVWMGVAAFVVALGAGVGVRVATTPHPPAVAVAKAASDSTHTADSLAAARPAASAANAPAPAADAAHTAAAPNAVVAASPAAGTPVPVPVPAIAASHHAEVLPSDYVKVAKILSQMKPKDAVAIFDHLSDDQVEGILRTLGVRPASTLLAAMSTTRAAEMSRRLMIPQPGARP
jgi:hypothetical protein